ncbi:MAG: hypothetical protein Kow0010_00650 [Dehalococcoidia bacterium]
MRVSILDPEGNLICRGEVSAGDDGRLALAVGPAARGVLFDHYFLRGQRRVVLSSDDVSIPCDLRTSWGGSQRLWWLLPLPGISRMVEPGALTA